MTKPRENYEYAVQHRTYIDKGFEESDTILTHNGRPMTKKVAQAEVSQYNKSPAMPGDTTGLPRVRLVRRVVGEWEPDER